MPGNIDALRTKLTGMIGGNTTKMMGPRLPRMRMGKAVTSPKPTKVKKAKALTSVSRVKGGSTTMTTPTIGGY